jgi:hypothetical protein
MAVEAGKIVGPENPVLSERSCRFAGEHEAMATHKGGASVVVYLFPRQQHP